MPRQSLKEQLAQHRKDRAAGKYTRKLSSFGKVGETEYTEGGRVERPAIYGLKWLRFFGEALVNQGVAYAAKVSTERWEFTGKVRLHLQRVVYEEAQAQSVTAGYGLVTPGALQVPLYGGVWESWLIPIEAVNAHDMRHVLKVIMGQKQADIVIAQNIQIRAMHGR